MNETSAVACAAANNPGNWRWMGAGYADEESMLDAAATAFEEAFANGGWDEERVALGCQLAWGAAWRSVSGAARAHGWICESVSDARETILRLSGATKPNPRAGSDGLCAILRRRGLL